MHWDFTHAVVPLQLLTFHDATQLPRDYNPMESGPEVNRNKYTSTGME